MLGENWGDTYIACAGHSSASRQDIIAEKLLFLKMVGSAWCSLLLRKTEVANFAPCPVYCDEDAAYLELRLYGYTYGYRVDAA